MDDRMRVSDADRERVTARLREHFADGRLTSDELDERITAALNAKTFGDLRAVMADLPEPSPVPPEAGQVPPPWALHPVHAYRRGPRLLPLALLVLFGALILSGGAGFVLVTFFKVILLVWLVTCLAGIFAAARFRRHIRRNWQNGPGSQWRQWEGRR
jgi:hypothetical protein